MQERRLTDGATVFGIVIGSALVVGTIMLGHSPRIFLNLPSFLLVAGGTLAATFIRNPMSAVSGTMAVVRKAFTTRLASPSMLIGEVVYLSRTARKESLLAMAKADIDDPFLARGISLCADGLEPEQIRSILETEISFTALRHKRGQEILEGMGASAPAFGMIGTLLGLVQMLTSLSDPKALGPAMAVAILTTLYGAVIAYLFALPLADKLKVRSREELLNMRVCLEGVIAIAQGDHPASVDEKLRAFLGPKGREAAA